MDIEKRILRMEAMIHDIQGDIEELKSNYKEEIHMMWDTVFEGREQKTVK